MKMMRVVTLLTLVLLVSVALVAQTAQPSSAAQQPGANAQAGQQQGADPVADQLKAARKLLTDGKQDEAIAAYEKIVQESPKTWQAHVGLGAALDLKGNYAEARKHFQHAIDMDEGDAHHAGLRNMAFSYAFEGDGKNAIKYEQRAYDLMMKRNDIEGAAGVLNEGARILLETGSIDEAEKWYRRGYETALKKPNITDAERNLWLWRWENAQARMAARRGQKDVAQKHVQAAKAALDKANDPDQAPFYPYLTGYVAFYGGDYKIAISELEKGNQKDPFVLSLIAQAHEKLGDNAKAQEFYKRVLEMPAHNPNGAFSRPLAQKKVGGAKS